MGSVVCGGLRRSRFGIDGGSTAFFEDLWVPTALIESIIFLTSSCVAWLDSFTFSTYDFSASQTLKPASRFVCVCLSRCNVSASSWGFGSTRSPSIFFMHRRQGSHHFRVSISIAVSYPNTFVVFSSWDSRSKPKGMGDIEGGQLMVVKSVSASHTGTGNMFVDEEMQTFVRLMVRWL